MINIRLLVIFFIVFSLSGCKIEPKQEMKNLMGKWYMKDVLFPQKIKLINKDNAGDQHTDLISLDTNKYYVLHFFTADCDKCLNEVKMAQEFIEKNKDINVQYFFIASGPTDLYVSMAVNEAKFKYPVFYEYEYFSFKHLNGFPENDKLYNTMLLNGKHKLLFFGGFFTNPKATALLKRLINTK